MNVSEAVLARRSTRAYLDKPVNNKLIIELLEKASRSPSGGNLQPWRIYIINGDAMLKFQKHLAEASPVETPAYEIYPASLKEPYRSSRYKVGEDMYTLLDVSRDDKEGRFKFLMENFRFFGAPAGFFCFADKQMGKPQWSDLGMFLQTFMLLAQEAGLSTCPQEAWAMRAQAVQGFVNAPEDQTLFCGMAIGYEDSEAKVNELRTDREAPDVFVKVVN
jgi:nitroreductase